MSAIAIGGLEILRFFRRRSTVWVFVTVSSFVALAYWFGAMFVGPGRWSYSGIEMMNRILMVVQVLGLLVVSWLAAKRSIEAEVSGGSFSLLAQTPVPGSRILLGKLFGVSVIVLFVHAFMASLVVLPTPVIRRPHWVFYMFLVGGWVLAVSMIPTGLAEALAGRKKWRRWLRHVSWALRIIGPVALLQMLILPESKAFGIGIWDVVVQFAQNVLGTSSVSATTHFGGPWVPIIVISAWFIFMAIVDWNRAVRSIRR